MDREEEFRRHALGDHVTGAIRNLPDWMGKEHSRERRALRIRWMQAPGDCPALPCEEWFHKQPQGSDVNEQCDAIKKLTSSYASCLACRGHRLCDHVSASASALASNYAATHCHFSIFPERDGGHLCDPSPVHRVSRCADREAGRPLSP